MDALKLLVHPVFLMALSHSSLCWAFGHPSISVRPSTPRTNTRLRLSNNGKEASSRPIACLVGYISPGQEEELKNILLNVGYESVRKETDGVVEDNTSSSLVFEYQYIKASGMLKLISNSVNDNDSRAPRYIPVQTGEENLLVANGWSFLDPDEAEPLSAFDVDAANAEGQYKPKWGSDEEDSARTSSNTLELSSLGYNLKRMNSEQILSEAEAGVSSESRSVLLDGGTDTPNVKMTSNGYDFSGSVSNIEAGLFTCAIGNTPLFATNDLSPLTGSSGWLSFARPVAEDHIKLVRPAKDAIDQRVEVVDARSGCHLGHYFGSDGYCINASALNFIPRDVDGVGTGTGTGTRQWDVASNPFSWQRLRQPDEKLAMSEQIVKQVLERNVLSREIIFGAGCFWHVEFALRRLPGVIDTKVGYAGGVLSSPLYKDVCNGDTNHAEVVKVTFDPNICEPRRMMDCFLAMHDPTVVRAHGKKAQGSGQYRSCIFILDSDMERIALDAVADCRKQLGKMLSTDVKVLTSDAFWIAENRHQLHDERVNNESSKDVVRVNNKRSKDVHTLSYTEWLLEYGRRSSSIWGSGETMQVADDSDDDGMARMMI